MQESLCQTMGQAEEDNILDLFACAAQTRADDFNQPHCNFRILSKQFREVMALNFHDLAVFDNDGVCSSRPAIQHRYFAKYVARHDQVQYCIIPLFGCATDPYRASANDIKLCSGVALVK